MTLHCPATDHSGYRLVVSPEDSPLRFLSFSLLRLEPGQGWEFELPGQEAVIVLLGGRADIGGAGFAWERIGEREEVFAGRATAVYLPPGSRGRVEAVSGLEAAVCTAPAAGGVHEPRPQLIPPEKVKIRGVGAQNWLREVHDIVDASFPAARLLVGETFNPPGNWSSYPPHKHDEIREGETRLEEVYYFRISPPGGFALQRVYREGEDQALVMRDGDTVAIPAGYHPVAAAPGYRVYYLWMLAGEERRLKPRDDPAHAWVRTLE
jgi:5-deoxy-glucuronate isomerase